jgi:hypothetical protein
MKKRGPGQWLNILSAALVLITVLRMGLFCGAVPIAGYANNLDFFRQSACIGVWQHYPGSPRIAAHLAGPVDDVEYDGHRDAYYCMRSSDNLFPWAVAHLFGKHAHFGLHDIGLAKAAVSAALVVFVVAQPVGAAARLAIALAFLLVFGDVATLAYFNTLYVDASGLIFTTVLVGLIAAVAGRRRAPGWGVWSVVAACVVWLGTVKPQYAALAALLGLVASIGFFAFWRDRVRSAALAVIAVLTPVLFFALNDGAANIMRVVDGVDVTDTVLEAVLPHARDPAQALRLVGLSPACGQDIGQNSYTLTASLRAACPRIGDVSRLRLIPLFLVQPLTFFGPLADAAGRLKAGFIGLAHFERAGDETLWRFRVLDATSLSTWLGALPERLYTAVVWLVMGGFFVSAAWLGVRLRGTDLPERRRVVCDAALPLAGGLVCAYAVVSSVFGDGYIELLRHAACAFVGIAFFLAGLAQLGFAALHERPDPVK